MNVELFQVTYQMPGKPAVTARGYTREGVRAVMNAVLPNGGWGCAIPHADLPAPKAPVFTGANGAPSYAWVRQAQCDGSVRWLMYRGLKRTRFFIERPAHVADRHSRALAYVLCCESFNRPLSASDEGAFKTLAEAKRGAERADCN